VTVFEQEATSGPPPRLSLQRNFSWTFVANIVYAGCQWGMLVALARLGSPALVGQFVLGLAVTGPIMLFSGLQLRAAQASDAGGIFRFSQYLVLRAASTVVGAAAVLALVFAWRHTAAETAVIFAITGAKAIEALIDQYYGLFQQHERMDFIAKSLMLRGLVGLAALAILVYLTRSVFWGALGIAGSNAIAFLAHDVPRSRCLVRTSGVRGGLEALAGCYRSRRSIWRLAVETLPLGCVSMMMSLNPNVPRYFVEHYLGPNPLGIFGAISYLHMVGNTAVSALCGSAIPRLSVLRDSGRRGAFRRLLVRVIGLSAATGACAVLASMLCGGLFLSLAYGREYAKHTDILLAQMIASALIFVAATMVAGLTAARKFRMQLPLWAVVVAVTASCCALLIPGGGLRGAGVAIVASAAIQVTITAIAVAVVLNREFRSDEEPAPAIPQYAD
jgi:O-antigen/teichoic acid export membrane protein